ASLAALRNRSLRQAEATVVVGDLMARKLEALGTPPARVHVIPNWCNDKLIRPVAHSENPLRQTWGLATAQFVFGYSGNLGRAHGFPALLAGGGRLAQGAEFFFLNNRGGKPLGQPAGTLNRQGLAGSFRFVPYQESKMLPYSL